MAKLYYLQDDTTRWVAEYLDQQLGRQSVPLVFAPVTMENIPQPNGKYRLPVQERKAVLLWGSGKEHHISYYFRPEEPYVKSVFDAHHDMWPYQWGDRLFCNNHNTALLDYDEFLYGMEVLGFSPEVTSPASSHNFVPSILSTSLKSRFQGNVMHQSIDLDVIKYYPCNPFYAHGHHAFSALKECFRETLKANEVIRLDIGGLFLKETGRKPDFSRGLKEYLELLEIYLECCGAGE